MTERDMIERLRALGYKVTKARAPRSNAKSRRHRDCTEHVPVDGYREPVCILHGQNRAAVIAFAVEVAAIGRHAACRAREGVACAA